MESIELRTIDRDWCVLQIPGDVKRLMHADSKLVLAGGFIRACISGETPSDVDLFCPTSEVAKEKASLLASAAGCHMIETENAYTVIGLKYPVQFVHRWTFETPDSVLEAFDFTVAAVAMFSANGSWKAICDPDFYADLAAKRLVYRSSTEPGGSLLRVLKFYQRGFRVTLDSLGAIVGGIATKTGKLKDGTSETEFVSVVAQHLREVDPVVQLV